MRVLTDAEMVAGLKRDLAPLLAKGLRQQDVSARLSELAGEKVSQSAVSRWFTNGAKRLESHTRRAVELMREEVQAGAWPESEERPLDELAVFVDVVDRAVRFAGGEGGNRKETARIVLRGLLQMATEDGNRPLVKRLEAELAKLGPAPVLETPTAASVLSFYERESRAAEERAVGMKEWAVAVRIAEEESRARRVGVSSTEEAIAIAEQGHAAVEQGERAPALPGAGPLAKTAQRQRERERPGQ